MDLDLQEMLSDSTQRNHLLNLTNMDLDQIPQE